MPNYKAEFQEIFFFFKHLISIFPQWQERESFMCNAFRQLGNCRRRQKIFEQFWKINWMMCMRQARTKMNGSYHRHKKLSSILRAHQKVSWISAQTIILECQWVACAMNNFAIKTDLFNLNHFNSTERRRSCEI